MSEGVIVALIGLATAAGGGLWVWLRSRKKDNVEAEAQRQVALSERFEDANELAKYIAEQIEKAVKPIRDELEKLKKEQDETHEALRAFFTQLWLWDIRGRLGPIPPLPTPLLKKLGLAHLVDYPAKTSTGPIERKTS